MRRIGQLGGEMAVLRDLGSLGAGALGMTGQFNADVPPDRHYGDETGAVLDAQLGLAGKRFGGEQQYQPQYGALGAQGYGATFGTLLSQLTGAGGRSYYQAQSEGRQADAADMSGLAPGVRAGVQAADPTGTNLLSTLLGNSQAEVSGGMSPGELRDVQQSIRAGQAARGMGYGPSDQAEEVYGVGLTSRQLRSDAANRAMGQIGASKNYYVDPVLALLQERGLAGAAPQLSQMLFASSGPRYFNPESSYASQLFSQNYGGHLATELENARNMVEYVKMNAKGGDSLSSWGAGRMGMAGGAGQMADGG